jgi:carbamate kinase
MILLKFDVIPIIGIGGGIPVMKSNDRLQGIASLINKNLVADLIGQQVNANK